MEEDVKFDFNARMQQSGLTDSSVIYLLYIIIFMTFYFQYQKIKKMYINLQLGFLEQNFKLSLNIIYRYFLCTHDVRKCYKLSVNVLKIN